MRRCFVCNRIIKTIENSVCDECKSNPFKVERLRDLLAKNGDLVELRKTYSRSFAYIKNTNTEKFWDKYFINTQNLKDQDGITRDRVLNAYKLKPKNTIRILDIGAGYGFIEELLSQNKKIEIYANDISKVAIKNLKTRFDGKFRTESIFTMKYPKNFFDTVFALEVLEHIPTHKIFMVLDKIKNILKAGGSFILSIPINEGLEQMSNNPNAHLRVYTEELINAELKIAGFKVKKIIPLYAFGRFYGVKKVLARILWWKWKPNDLVILAVKE